MTRVFVVRDFERWSRKQRIADATLLEAIARAEAGLVDANLKGCLVKLRVARPGGGRSSGYRTIVAYHARDRAFFLYGFAKNDRGNITEDEESALAEFGELLLNLTVDQLLQLTSEGKTREIVQ